MYVLTVLKICTIYTVSSLTFKFLHMNLMSRNPTKKLKRIRHLRAVLSNIRKDVH